MVSKTRRRSMRRNYKRNDDSSSSRTRVESGCAPWSDLDHDVLFLVMMKLRFGDYYSFKGVCKSWRSFARENQKNFMGPRPPMSVTINCRAHEKTCYLEDFEGRRFKTILPPSPVFASCLGLTCGFLIFFVDKTRSFWLVSPITRKELHFPHDCPPFILDKHILVFSSSKSEMVFLVLFYGKIWFSTEGKGAWNCVSNPVFIWDLYAFKGKIYTLSDYNICEVGLGPQPNLTVLTLKGPNCGNNMTRFVRSGEKLYAKPWFSSKDDVKCVHEFNLDEMKWVNPREKTLAEYAIFRSDFQDTFVAVKRESWADPRSWSYADTADEGENMVFDAKMWYFPNQYMDVDCIDD